MAISPSSGSQNGVTATFTLSGSEVIVEVSSTSLYWRINGTKSGGDHGTYYIKENRNDSGSFEAEDGHDYAFQVCSSGGTWSNGLIFEVEFDRELTIDQGTGTTITVKRNGTTLWDGATIKKGDKLTITISANEGYELTDQSHTSGSTITVSDDVYVYATAKKKTYKLSISEGTGTNVSVTRDGITLSNGSTIAHGDYLTVEIYAEEGYKIDTRSHNDGTYSVSGNVSVYATASLLSYILSIDQGEGTTISVKRNGVALSGGSTINYGDSLTISISANTGYDLDDRSHNNGTYVVTEDVYVYASATKKTYILSIDQGEGTTITVKRDGVTLYDGAYIEHGDSLTIVISANQDYKLESRSHEDGTIDVSDNVSVSATASKLTYKLSISQGVGSVMSVKRNGTALANYATITYNDVLEIKITASTGYDIVSRSHNDGAFVVNGNVNVSATAIVKSFKLTLSAGVGSSITVNRTSSPKGNALTGNLSNGDTIYYSDVLKITFGALTGYSLSSRKVNDLAFTSGNTHTVEEAVFVVSAATVKSFKLTISADEGSVITVNRTSSPKKGASTGKLSTGATIYYSDVLKISVATELSYEVESLFVNGKTFVSGKTHTVVSAVTVTTSTGRLGLAYINDEPYIIVIDEETEWVQCIPQVDEETEWVICS